MIDKIKSGGYFPPVPMDEKSIIGRLCDGCRSNAYKFHSRCRALCAVAIVGQLFNLSEL